MSVPVVLVTSDSLTFNGLEASGTPATYLNAAALAGLTPLQVPTIAEGFAGDPLLDIASGIVVTGARSNVHPSNYGMPETKEAEPFDKMRDRTTLPLIQAAIDERIPLLCICRGMQELNVVLGGTLHTAVHNVKGRDDHRGADTGDMDERFQLKHDVAIQPGGVLRQVLGADTIKVNSVHRQGIDRPGRGLMVEALASDGTIEAVSLPSHPFALAVQWHPEYFAHCDAPSRAVFDAFADAVRDYASGRPGRVAA